MASGSPNPSLYLLDAHGLIFQVFHAIQTPMSSPAGLPTNALYGFLRDVLFLRSKKPDYLVCAFDVAGPTFREKIYPEYKAHRSPPPSDLELQIPLIREALEALRVPVLGVPGFEADDVIATLAAAAAARGIDVFICSSDKDCRQLLSERIKIYSLRKRSVFGPEELMQDWGIRPEQVIDFQALVGDSVDNVPGVEGIGEKTAAKLLQEFGTLENLLANAGKVSGAKRKQALRDCGQKVALSRSLVALRTDVPVPLAWDEWRLRDYDTPRLLALFKEWGLREFAEQVTAQTAAAVAKPAARRSRKQSGSAAVQGDLFGDGAAAADGAPERPVKAAWDATYHLVDTEAKFTRFLAALKKQKRIAVDLETTDLDPRRAELVGLSFCWKPAEAYYLAVRGPEGDAKLDPKTTLERLRPLLEADAPAKVNQNVKYDLLVLRQQGVRLGGVRGDPMVADYLLHAGERNHNMEVLAKDYLHHQVIPITDLIGKKGKGQRRMDEVATARVAEYAGEDADVALRLCEQLEPLLDGPGLRRLYEDLEIPLIEVLAELEHNGIRLDVPFLNKLGADMTRQLAAIEKEIYQLAGHEFNIASLKQLRLVLFQELKLRVVRKTDTTGEPSTDQETLEELAAEHPLPAKLIEHRKVAKLKGTYVDALPEMVNPQTGRIHASFNQTVAATGRLSSSDPNLQNVPIRTEQGGQIRQAFVPEPGWVLLAADYSQIELRLLAHFCGDEGLRRAFAEDRDVHASVAAQIYGVAEKDVTPEMRRRAKTVNFGVIYGISPFGLARRLEITKEEAAGFIDAYFQRYPKVLAYQDRLLADCRARGHVSTILGRRRVFDARAVRPDSTYQQRNQAEREAINMEIQGSAADLMKVAMLNVYRRLQHERRQARMLLQIHDELVFEAPPEELNDIAALAVEEMTGALAARLTVPLKVDVAAGPNWLDVEELNHGIHENHGKGKKKQPATPT
jgi:DNA polymerase-1